MLCGKSKMSRFMGWPFGEIFGEDQNQMNKDLSALVILAGMAKPGDTPEQIKSNIATDNEYAKAVELQQAQMKDDMV